MPATRCRSLLLHRLAAGLGCALAAGGACASESFVVGPRAEGMGGVGVACADDGVAQYYNPAVFGFFTYPQKGGDRVASDNQDLHRKRWGIEVDAEAGARQGDGFANRIDELDKVDFNALRGTTFAAGISLVDLSRAGNAMVHLADPGNTLTGFGDGGGSVRVWRVGLGVRGYGTFTGYVPSVDLADVGLPKPGGDPNNFAQDINATQPAGDGQVKLLTGLSAKFQARGALAADANAATQRLDFAARQAGVSSADAAKLENLYDQMYAQYGNDTFKNNTTQVALRGLGVTEIPVTYGQPIGDHFAVGGSVKLMIGRAYATDVSIFSGDSAKDTLKHANDNYQQSVAVGVDLGVLWRTKMLQAGLTGRNLNEPSFQGAVVNGVRQSDEKIDRQFTAGGAFIPWPTLTVEVDYDLNKVHGLAPGYDIQNLSGGVEWNPWHFIALRAGVSDNTAESDVGAMLHAGLGLNLWAVRIDLAGAVSARKTTVNDKSLPREAEASLGVGVDF